MITFVDERGTGNCMPTMARACGDCRHSSNHRTRPQTRQVNSEAPYGQLRRVGLLGWCRSLLLSSDLVCVRRGELAVNGEAGATHEAFARVDHLGNMPASNGKVA